MITTFSVPIILVIMIKLHDKPLEVDKVNQRKSFTKPLVVRSTNEKYLKLD